MNRADFWIGVQSIEDAAFAGTERLSAFVTDRALFLLALHANIVLPGLTPCRTV